jgi:hypothetical protein
MPSKLDDASNLRFLYACLQTCDFPQIDYHKVAKQFGIQAPAARMRLRRLRDSLEGKEGGSKVSKKQMAGDGRPRPRGGKKINAKEGYEKNWNGHKDDDDDDDDDDVPLESLKSRGHGDGDGLKKEDREEETEDWKMLPESRPVLRPAVPEAQMYEMRAFEPADAKMPPAASPVRQMTLQVQPQMQMPMYDMAEPYMFPSGHVALPQMPYYHTSFPGRLPEQHQHRPQYEAAAPPSERRPGQHQRRPQFETAPSPSEVLPDSKESLLVEEISGEHVVDSK